MKHLQTFFYTTFQVNDALVATRILIHALMMTQETPRGLNLAGVATTKTYSAGHAHSRQVRHVDYTME